MSQHNTRRALFHPSPNSPGALQRGIANDPNGFAAHATTATIQPRNPQRQISPSPSVNRVGAVASPSRGFTATGLNGFPGSESAIGAAPGDFAEMERSEANHITRNFNEFATEIHTTESLFVDQQKVMHTEVMRELRQFVKDLDADEWMFRNSKKDVQFPEV